MLYLELKDSKYKGCNIDIHPENDSEIPGLRYMIDRNLIIENPAVTFSNRLKGGGYNDLSEDEIERKAGMVNDLDDLWDEHACMNVLMLLSRAMQKIVDLKQMYMPPEIDEEPDDIPDDWL